MVNSSIKVLVVEDNLVVQRYLRAALATDPQIEVVAVVDDGNVAVEKVRSERPDLLLLDLFLNGIDGIEVINSVMSSAACPIVVLSGQLDRQDRDLTFEAQRSGAVEVLEKPSGMSEAIFAEFSDFLCRTVRVMSRIHVTTRKNKPVIPAPAVVVAPEGAEEGWDLVVIGSSTGGPAAVYYLLEAIRPCIENFSVLVAQHISEGFSGAFCEWLGNTGCNVKIAEDGEIISKGQVYLAADNMHLEVAKDGTLAQLCDDMARFVPSVDRLFTSVAENYTGSVCAIVLTGMGNDGSEGIVKLYRNGTMTVAQDEESSVIYGMPAAAVETGAVKSVLSLQQMPELFSGQQKVFSVVS